MATETSARRVRLVAALVALLALLPFARGLLTGRSFFFRDLGGYFFPLRLFAVRGLLEGELRYWNPLTHEGEPLTLPPIGYLPDLLQALVPSEAGLSLLLALHFPLAALGAFFLARHLGRGVAGAAAAAVAYSLSGFALSSLNFYAYAQALGWAPWVVVGLGRAAAGSRREVAAAAVVIAMALSTTGVEIVAQALLAGLLLAQPWSRRPLGRCAIAVALGIGLSGVVLLPLQAFVADSARGQGLAPEVVLAHSVHPITLLQTVVGGLYAETARFTDTFWGQNYFPRGFPYFLSLYVGPLALGLALLGATERSRLARSLAALALLGLLVSLGRYAGLEPLLSAFPALRTFRFPSKAFFTVHLAMALLLAFGVDALERHGRRDHPRERRVPRGVLLIVGLGLVVGLSPWSALQPPGLRRLLLSGFFPPEMPWPLREAASASIARDALAGGLLAVFGGFVAWGVSRRLLSNALGAGLVVAVLAGDLLRTGAGLNPMVSAFFFRPSPEVREIARRVLGEDGRLFTLDAGQSPAYYVARARRAEHEVWSFAVLQETLNPSFNLAVSVPTALSLDQTMLVPEARILAPQDATAAALPRALDRLRAAAVSHVLAVEPLDHPDLEPVLRAAPARIAPLQTHLYRLRASRPRASLLGGGRIVARDASHFVVEAAPGGAATLVVRDAWAPGVRAYVDGRETPVDRHEGRHRAVGLEPGRHEVTFVYRPPGLRPGLALSLGSALVVLALLVSRRAPR